MEKGGKKYVVKEQLGLKGKDGKTFLVLDKFGYTYAMKTFRKNKSVEGLTNEVELQKLCSVKGIAPKIIDFDKKNKFIVMEKMDYHLLYEINKSNGKLSLERQKELIHIFKTMDKLKVLHGDVNLLNYMVKNGKLYIIDFGMGRTITDSFKKREHVTHPNMELSLLGFILILKDANVDKSSYSFLKNFLSEEKKKQFNIL
jgi:tRNA A-37 threonylcarbamoyl transferase component Bud32